MLIPKKQLQSGFAMPVFGLGTYAMGQGDDARDLAAISMAIKAGVTHIDTAEVYASGHTEELVGRILKTTNRKKIFLVSKVAGQHLNYKGIKNALQNSLRRLGTQYLDLYLMHRCPSEANFKAAVQAMNELVEEGLVKHIGLSNTNTEHTKRLCALSKHPFVANQVHYNLQFREPEKDGLLDYCQKNDMLLIAWRPLNKGALSKSGMDITKPGIPVLDKLCQKYDKTPAQIAINWLISQPNVITLAKTSTPAHLLENLGGVGWQMSPEDIKYLRLNFPNQHYLSDTVPLA